jgi:hypothetical protein
VIQATLRAVWAPNQLRTRHYVDSTELSTNQLDHIAIERALNGETIDGLTPAEQYEAARLLTDRGIGPAEIARRTGAEPRSIQRWKAAGFPDRAPHTWCNTGRPRKTTTERTR